MTDPTNSADDGMPDMKADIAEFDPTKEENWHYHDEYEFWYIGYPERRKPNNVHIIDLARERGFKPWENIRPDLAHPPAPTPAAMTREEMQKVRDAMDHVDCCTIRIDTDEYRMDNATFQKNRDALAILGRALSGQAQGDGDGEL